MRELGGRVVFVTGGASGIFLAMAEALGRQSAPPSVTARV
jgi:NAD(P)-dependent dehydrogenase (short-subunit alcohol dehydrogenase family)